MNWAEFFAMGGYAFYVWASYVIAAVVLALNVLIPLRRRKTVQRALREFYRLTTPGTDDSRDGGGRTTRGAVAGEVGGVGNKPLKGGKA